MTVPLPRSDQHVPPADLKAGPEQTSSWRVGLGQSGPPMFVAGMSTIAAFSGAGVLSIATAGLTLLASSLTRARRQDAKRRLGSGTEESLFPDLAEEDIAPPAICMARAWLHKAREARNGRDTDVQPASAAAELRIASSSEAPNNSGMSDAGSSLDTDFSSLRDWKGIASKASTAALEALEVKLERRHREPWGLAWRGGIHGKRPLVVAGIGSDSPAGRWNARQQDLGLPMIKRGDRLVAANNATCRAGMRQELATATVLRLRFIRSNAGVVHRVQEELACGKETSSIGDTEKEVGRGLDGDNSASNAKALPDSHQRRRYESRVKNTFIEVAACDSLTDDRHTQSDPMPVRRMVHEVHCDDSSDAADAGASASGHQGGEVAEVIAVCEYRAGIQPVASAELECSIENAGECALAAYHESEESTAQKDTDCEPPPVLATCLGEVQLTGGGMGSACADGNLDLGESEQSWCVLPEFQASALPAGGPDVFCQPPLVLGPCLSLTTMSMSVDGTSASGFQPVVPEMCWQLMGKQAVISGLLQSPQFNGHWCQIEAFDEEAQRYVVRILQAGKDGGPVTAKLRMENLMLPVEWENPGPGVELPTLNGSACASCPAGYDPSMLAQTPANSLLWGGNIPLSPDASLLHAASGNMPLWPDASLVHAAAANPMLSASLLLDPAVAMQPFMDESAVCYDAYEHSYMAGEGPPGDFHSYGIPEVRLAEDGSPTAYQEGSFDLAMPGAKRKKKKKPKKKGQQAAGSFEDRGQAVAFLEADEEKEEYTREDALKVAPGLVPLTLAGLVAPESPSVAPPTLEGTDAPTPTPLLASCSASARQSPEREISPLCLQSVLLPRAVFAPMKVRLDMGTRCSVLSSPRQSLPSEVEGEVIIGGCQELPDRDQEAESSAVSTSKDSAQHVVTPPQHISADPGATPPQHISADPGSCAAASADTESKGDGDLRQPLPLNALPKALRDTVQRGEDEVQSMSRLPSKNPADQKTCAAEEDAVQIVARASPKKSRMKQRRVAATASADAEAVVTASADSADGDSVQSIARHPSKNSGPSADAADVNSVQTVARPLSKKAGPSADAAGEDSVQSVARPPSKKAGPSVDAADVNSVQTIARPLSKKAGPSADAAGEGSVQSVARPLLKKAGPSVDAADVNSVQSIARPLSKKAGPSADGADGDSIQGIARPPPQTAGPSADGADGDIVQSLARPSPKNSRTQNKDCPPNGSADPEACAAAPAVKDSLARSLPRKSAIPAVRASTAAAACAWRPSLRSLRSVQDRPHVPVEHSSQEAPARSEAAATSVAECAKPPREEADAACENRTAAPTTATLSIATPAPALSSAAATSGPHRGATRGSVELTAAPTDAVAMHGSTARAAAPAGAVPGVRRTVSSQWRPSLGWNAGEIE